MLTSQQNNLLSKQAPLSLRLSAIAESLPKGGIICDVGSDHGALPLFLLCSGKCSEAIVTDLNEKPLERAKANLREAGVDKKASFVLTDGIEEILPLKPDAFVIAGMGGETILGILQRGLDRIPEGTQFILQPMTKIGILRRFLYESGFRVMSEKLIFENEKFFVVIQAVFDGVSRTKNALIYEFGEFFSKNINQITRAYITSTLSSLENVIAGKKTAGVEYDDERNKRAYLLKLLEATYEDKRD